MAGLERESGGFGLPLPKVEEEEEKRKKNKKWRSGKIEMREKEGNGTRNGESYGIDINNVTACIRKPFSSQFCCQNKHSPNLGRCYGSVSDCQSNCPNDPDPHNIVILWF
uniref:Uncharacterized protein n=1 Tax=Oryza punctata TaxID=4537 RepID=A0A0E0LZ94_ORYPU